MITILKAGDSIPANDRIAQYGDGCFSTMNVKDGHIELLSRHLGRLRDACVALSIDFSQWSLLHQTLIELSQNELNLVLKVVISRGVGGRGYSPKDVINAHAYISLAKVPVHYISQRNLGISAGIGKVRLGHQPVLAGIKHCNRLEQVLIKNENHQTVFDDLLVLDLDGHVIESSAGNIFYRSNEIWNTPKLDLCGVSGVMRNYIMDLMLDNKISVLESKTTVEDLISAEEIFICNSLMKIVPIKTLNVGNKVKEFNINSRNFSAWFAHNQNEVSLHG